MSTTRVEDGPRVDAVPTDTMFGALARAAASAPEGRLALAGLRDGTDWAEYDYPQLLDAVERASAGLRDLGVTTGDVVVVVLPNWVESVLYLYAAARLGAVVCPVTTIYRQRELGFILDRTACSVVIAPTTYRGFDYASMVAELAVALPVPPRVVTVGEGAPESVVDSRSITGAEDVEAPTVAPVGPDDLAVLAFTSGTTGEPKGVMHSHRSIHGAVDGFVGHAALADPLPSLVISPFGHLTGFTWGVLMPYRRAGTVVMLESWNPATALELGTRYGIEVAVGATPFLSDLVRAAADGRHRLPRIFVCAGAPIPPVLVERASREHGCRVVSAWGMSEYPIGTAVGADDPPEMAVLSDGRACGRAEIRIVDDAGRPVAVGVDGDLLVRGPGLCIGYHARPDLDEVTRTADGFLRTGDRGRAVDDRGFVRITGRTKDVIIRGGENIPVIEIENLLLTHPAVADVALVPFPDERLGEIACACIVPEPGERVPDVAALGMFLGGLGVARQFTPEVVVEVAELPRTPTGKVQKFALRDSARAVSAR